jgi:hypothetical protein
MVCVCVCVCVCVWFRLVEFNAKKHLLPLYRDPEEEAGEAQRRPAGGSTSATKSVQQADEYWMPVRVRVCVCVCE